MDDVMRDPELGPEVMNFSLKLLTEKLNQVRRDLDQEKQSNSALQVEVLQYKDAATKPSEGREPSILSNIIKENSRLKRELADLRTTLDSSSQRNPLEMVFNASHNASSLATIQHLEEQVQRLENELTLEHEEVAQARQRLHNVNEEYEKCKIRVRKLEAEAHNYQNRIQSAETPSMPPVPHRGLEVDTLPTNVKEAIDAILSRPCIPQGSSIKPDDLPSDLKRYLYGGSVFYFPDRTAYPVQNRMARIFAPQTEYALVNGKLVAGQPKNELHVHINTVRELFVDTPHGICYVGTYRASKVLEMSKELYVKLDKGPREAIVRRTLATEAHFLNIDQAQQSRLRNLYMLGTAKAEYLVLHFVGFNYALFGALLALKDAKPAGGEGDRDTSSDSATRVATPFGPPPGLGANGTGKLVLSGGPKAAVKEKDVQPPMAWPDSQWNPSDWS